MTGIFPRDRKSLGIIAVFVVALFLPFAPGMNLYYLTLMNLMLIFIMFASAWNFLAYSGQGSLGHAAFFGLGGYASALIAVASGITPYVTIFFGGAFAALIGLLIGLTVVRLKEWFLAMVTFGFAIIIQTLLVSQFASITGGWDGFAVPRLISSNIPHYQVLEYYSILLLTVLAVLAIYLIFRSRIGLAMAAIRENELEARAAGIDPVKFKLFAFTISAYIAGIAGALEIHLFGYITPEIFGAEISFWPIIYSIAGGLGTLLGPVIGTIVVTFLWDGLNSFGLTYERFIIIGVLLLAIIIFLPRGLISLPEALRRWREREEQKKGA
jgi:branched-chain amino acid transport system permease protein